MLSVRTKGPYTPRGRQVVTAHRRSSAGCSSLRWELTRCSHWPDLQQLCRRAPATATCSTFHFINRFLRRRRPPCPLIPAGDGGEAPQQSTTTQHARPGRMFGAIRVRVSGSPPRTQTPWRRMLADRTTADGRTRSTTPVCPSARVSLATALSSGPEAMGCPDSGEGVPTASARDKALFVCASPSPVVHRFAHPRSKRPAQPGHANRHVHS